MPVHISGDQVCWLCGGGGVVTTGEAARPIVCGMCDGSGVTDEVPGSAAEMVSMIAGMKGVERIRLTEADIDVAVAEYGPIIEAAMREIEEEDAAQAGQSSTPGEHDSPVIRR
jgi:hypothetical protein